MSLANRLAAFEIMGKRFSCERPSPLTFAYRIPEPLFRKFQIAVAIYMSRSLSESEVILDEGELLAQFEARQERIPNITPNGMIVPKRNSILEYNFVVQTFAQIIGSLNVSDLIHSWHVPLNVRIKFSEVSELNMKRPHPTEHPHSDSWAGESAESVTTHIPVFGDTERNFVDMFYPPDDFQEEWLGARPSYKDGAVIVPRYRRIDYIAPKGTLLIMDFATLHASTRNRGAGARVSIDTTFVLRKPGQDMDHENIHQWRKEERVTHDILSSIGETHLFHFPDRPDQQVDSQGGFKHPSNLHLRALQ